MATETSISNMALANIGAKSFLNNLRTDKSVEADICRIYYDEALKFTLQDGDWQFATARIKLAELSEDAPIDWDYIYTYPSDCLKARRIFTGAWRAGMEKIPFETGLNADRTIKAIFTDQYQACLRFTANVTDTNLFPTSFAMLHSHYMSALISYPLTKKASVRDAAIRAYQNFRISAEVNDIEEKEEDNAGDSEFIRERM